VLAVTLCVIFTVAQAPAQTASTKTVSGGRLTVTLDTSFLQAVRSVGISPIRTRPANLRHGVLTLPISVGSIDTTTGQIELVSSGGFAFTAGTTQVQLGNRFFTVLSGQQAVVSAMLSVNGNTIGRVALFDLQLPRLTLPLKPDANGDVTIGGIQFTLSDQIATALNTNFGTSAFTAGMPVGTATIVVHLGISGEGF
jgi:hypothetical protein